VIIIFKARPGLDLLLIVASIAEGLSHVVRFLAGKNYTPIYKKQAKTLSIPKGINLKIFFYADLPQGHCRPESLRFHT